MFEIHSMAPLGGGVRAWPTLCYSALQDLNSRILPVFRIRIIRFLRREAFVSIHLLRRR